MKNNLYIILATLLFLTGVVNIHEGDKIQVSDTLLQNMQRQIYYTQMSVSGDPQPIILNGNKCHVVEGTKIYIKFPASTSIKNLDSDRTLTPEEDGTFIDSLIVGKDTEKIIYEVKDGSLIIDENVIDAIIQEQDYLKGKNADWSKLPGSTYTGYLTIWFEVYDSPIIKEPWTVSPPSSYNNNYALQPDNNIKFTPNFEVSEEITKSSMFKYKIQWHVLKDGTDISPDAKTSKLVNSDKRYYYLKDPGVYELSATLTVYATSPNSEDNSEDEFVWAESQSDTLTFTIYEKPEVKDLTVSSNLAYTYKGGPNRTITASYNSTPKELSQIEWYVDEATNPVEGANDDTYTFNPNDVTIPEGSDYKDVKIKAVVSIMEPAPEGQEAAVWKKDSRETTITVYAKPAITIPANKYALKGDAPFDTGLDITPVEGLQTSVEWEVKKDGSSVTGYIGEDGKFNPKETGTFVVTATVTIKHGESGQKLGVETWTETITVYAKPSITIPANKYALKGDNPFAPGLDITPVEGLQASVEWEVKKDGSSVTGYIGEDGKFNPKETGTFVVTARVTIKPVNASDVELLSASKTETITVYAKPSLTLPANKYALKGDNSFAPGLDITPVEGLQTSVEWEVKKDGSSVTGYIGEDGKFNPKETGTFVVTATVTIKHGESGQKLGEETKSTIITVYKVPEITSIESNKAYTYVGDDAFDVTISIEKDPNITIFTDSISWECDNVTEHEITTDEANVTTITGRFTPPEEANEDGVEVWAQIVFSAPDSTTLITLSSETTKIIVLPNPTVEVTDLKEKVTQPDTNPQKIIAYEGQPDVSFNYSVITPDNRYKWEYKWVLDNDTIISKIDTASIANDKQLLDVTNNQKTEHTVTLYAQAFNPDDNLDEEHKEPWGDPIECTLSPITIYPAPNYKEEDLHETTSTPIVHEYAIFKGETLDATKLYTATGGYSPNDDNYGWKPEISITLGGQTINPTEQMKFTPDKSGKYNLTLTVKNTAPTGEWCDTTTVYTLHVYDKPEWDATDIASKFEEGETVLNVESGDTLDITANLETGETEWWRVNCYVNNGDEESFAGTGNKRTYEHIFDLTEEEPQEIPLKIDISYNYESKYLLKGQKDVIDNIIKGLPTSIERTIVVWRKITAEVAVLNKGSMSSKHVMVTMTIKQYKSILWAVTLKSGA